MPFKLTNAVFQALANDILHYMLNIVNRKMVFVYLGDILIFFSVRKRTYVQ